MGVALFIVLDNEDPGFDMEVDGKAVGKAGDKLNAVCQAMDLPPIDDFISMSMDDVEDMLGEEMPEVEDRWFEADEGITYFEKIVSHLGEHPAALTRSDRVIEDIEQYLSILHRAKKIGARWRLGIDI